MHFMFSQLLKIPLCKGMKKNPCYLKKSTKITSVTFYIKPILLDTHVLSSLFPHG